MKKLFMLTLLSTLLMSRYLSTMEEKESLISEDTSKFLTKKDLLEEKRSNSTNLLSIITAYRSVLPEIEKFVKNDFGERLQEVYQQLKTTLTEKDPLINAFETNQSVIDKAENLLEVVEKIETNLLDLIKNNSEKYHLKYIALFWAINLAKSNKSYELEKNELRKSMFKKNADIFKEKAQTVIAQIQSPYQGEYKNKLLGQAKVNNRAIGAISDDEQNIFLNARIPKIAAVQNQVFKKFLDDEDLAKIEKTPLRIGMAFSGGGYRAMVLTAGYMEALENLGVLDSCLYISTLSGSTWFMAPWILTGKRVSDYKQDLQNIITKPEANVKNLMTKKKLALSPDFLYDIILPKFVFDIPFSSVDLYGAFLTEALLEQVDPENRHALSLYMQWQMVKDGSSPLPIYTSISENVIKNWYNWYEFNPLEIENLNLGFSIPSWAFGRKFNNGESTTPQFPQEVSLGYLMGLFGSAYAIDVLHNIDNIHLAGYENWVAKLTNYFEGLKKATQETGRLYPAFIYNPWKNLPEKYLSDKVENLEILQSILTKEEKFAFVDAGINFNLPILPLLKGGRDLDVIIIGDATQEGWASIDGEIYPGEIAKFIEYIQPWGITYHRAKNIWGIDIYIPELTNYETAKTFITRSPRFKLVQRLPIIVYFGFAKQPGLDFNPEKYSFWDTFNFEYNSEQFGALSKLAQHTIERREEVLIATLWYAYKKRLKKELPLRLEEPDLEEILRKVTQPQLISEEEKISDKNRLEFKKTNNIFALFDRMWEYDKLYQRMADYAETKEELNLQNFFIETIDPNSKMVLKSWAEKRNTTMLDICRYVLDIRYVKWKNEAIILKAYLDQQKRIIGSQDLLENKETVQNALDIIEKAKNMLLQQLK